MSCAPEKAPEFGTFSTLAIALTVKTPKPYRTVLYCTVQVGWWWVGGRRLVRRGWPRQVRVPPSGRFKTP